VARGGRAFSLEEGRRGRPLKADRRSPREVIITGGKKKGTATAIKFEKRKSFIKKKSWGAKLERKFKRRGEKKGAKGTQAHR